MSLNRKFHRRKFFKYVSLTTGTLLFVAGCNQGVGGDSNAKSLNFNKGKEPNAGKETIRLAQNLSPISGVTIVAKGKNFFDDHGLDVQVSNFTSGKQCLDTAIGGGADIATTAEAPITAFAMANQRIAFLTRMEYSDLKTLAATSAGVATLADLRNKRIGFTAGTGGEVYTLRLLKKAGLSLKDVTLVNLRSQEMLPALSSGSIDAYNTWEPHINNGVKALGNKVTKLDTKGVYSETFNIVTTTDYLEKKSAVLQNFIRALLDAEKWMKSNREDAITLVASTVGMKREDLAPIWDDYVYEVVLDQKTIDILKAHAAWRLESGNHPPGGTMPDFTKIIYPGPLRAVAPNRVKISGI
ncbi:MAG: NrtA/SsuA/CpmA family ABC transporter substrate-binding protein [Gloeocapsa sp. UFS-A4-WI-NPMV-4B04]|jgi:NitT/TauT family transport system substrate-binding protein|nr:NrtA/SsuA/CpmA family ABC transporter substrate-binding protein [Gloeocapsa sp. UFS-A4-WI-NPMV-4B04]